MVCQLPTVRYSPRYRIHWIYEFICACNLIMRDSWIDEVHMSASWLCSLFLSHLLSLGSSDRSHNAFIVSALTNPNGRRGVYRLYREESKSKSLARPPRRNTKKSRSPRSGTVRKQVPFNYFSVSYFGPSAVSSQPDPVWMNARYGPAPKERSTCTRRVSWFRRVVDVVVDDRRPRR